MADDKPGLLRDVFSTKRADYPCHGLGQISTPFCAGQSREQRNRLMLICRLNISALLAGPAVNHLNWAVAYWNVDLVDGNAVTSLRICTRSGLLSHVAALLLGLHFFPQRD